MIVSDLVKKVITATQNGLPVDDQPYAVVAEQVGISEAELMNILKELQSDGLIRRIGLVPNHYALGYRYNLMTTWDIDDDYIDELGGQVGALEFVSHSYKRPRHLPDWPYNLFAMVHGKSHQEVDKKVAVIKTILGDHSRSMTQLNSTKILKKTGLRVR